MMHCCINILDISCTLQILFPIVLLLMGNSMIMVSNIPSITLHFLFLYTLQSVLSIQPIKHSPSAILLSTPFSMTYNMDCHILVRSHHQSYNHRSFFLSYCCLASSYYLFFLTHLLLFPQSISCQIHTIVCYITIVPFVQEHLV